MRMSAWACVQSTTFGTFAARSAVQFMRPRTGRKSGEIAVRTEIFADHGGIATESVSVRDASRSRCTGAPSNGHIVAPWRLSLTAGDCAFENADFDTAHREHGGAHERCTSARSGRA